MILGKFGPGIQHSFKQKKKGFLKAASLWECYRLRKGRNERCPIDFDPGALSFRQAIHFLIPQSLPRRMVLQTRLELKTIILGENKAVNSP
jgi:hypothetical protein